MTMNKTPDLMYHIAADTPHHNKTVDVHRSENQRSQSRGRDTSKGEGKVVDTPHHNQTVDVRRSENQRSQSRGRDTSKGEGKLKSGHRVHGTKAHKDDECKKNKSARSKSTGRRAPLVRREHHTPFDDKGRCHYHVNVQLASKKMTGGWKILLSACPKCMEQKHDSRDHRHHRPVKSLSAKFSADATADGKKFDGNGCCVIHSHIQIAKKSVLGGGWKFMRTCPSCDGGVAFGLDDDNLTVKTSRSISSRKSTKLLGMTKLSKSKPSESGRYGALPFNGDGYCCVHPGVQIALKKKTGGFKIIHDVCPECATAEGVGGGRASNNRRNQSVSREGRHRSASRHRRSRGDKNDNVKRSEPACVAKKRIAWADMVVSVSCI